jgi:hypothetical protein
MRARLLVPIVLCATSVACGDGASGVVDPVPVATPTPAPVTTVVAQAGGPLDVEEAAVVDFTVPSAGTVAATVDWTFATNHVITALTPATCDDADAAFLGACAQIGAPRLDMAKPKTISGTAAAGAWRLWVGNLGPDAESVAVQVTMTRAAGAAGAQGETRTATLVRVPMNAATRARILDRR